MQDGYQRLIAEYCSSVKRMNLIYSEKMDRINNDISEMFARDWKDQYQHMIISSFADEIVNLFAHSLNMPECISASQLYKRISEFSYEKEYDPLYKRAIIRKDVNDTIAREVNEKDNITRISLKRHIFYNGKKVPLAKFYDEQINGGMDYVFDELTGEMRVRREVIDKRGIPIAVLAGDHKIPIAEACINEHYTKNISKMIDELDHIYNDRDNIWYIGARTNTLKNDAATYQEAIKKIEKGVKNNPDSLELLKKEGTVDENGRVKPEIVQRLKKEYQQGRKLIDIKLDKAQLSNLNVNVVFSDATNKMFGNAKATKSTIFNAVFPQLAYYVVPPVVYEVRIIMKTENNVNSIMDKLVRSGERIINYVVSKLQYIVEGVALNILKDFVSVVFDIIVSLLFSFLKDMINLGRKLVISLIDSISILFESNRTKEEKFDAISKLISVTISNCAVELIFAKLKSVGLPESCSWFLQMICSVLISNLIFVMLDEWDLFSVRFGFNIRKVNELFEQFEEELHNELQMVICDFDNSANEILNEIRMALSVMSSKMGKEDAASSIIETSKMLGSKVNYDEKIALFLGDKK